MTQIRVLLPELLAQHRLNRKQLVEGSGVRHATINDMYIDKRQPSLDTLHLASALEARAHGDIRFLTFDPDLAAVAGVLLSKQERA
ncbi:helix-turn-helix transcriptional regulator [Deinococcus sp. AJ005]|uniref:helix-turn-helix domain-containing protein n=1 Tax=Deinococcus sp. AJ005 TaxID=2652443 RepID=UPI00125CA90D|nr:helix-turn-helix transcriptional regulator [Deinococcus sp. AJ005]QFP77460.1 hypothetical protein DAAJ005_14055 [Deinococcus sp. AJ005]